MAFNTRVKRIWQCENQTQSHKGPDDDPFPKIDLKHSRFPDRWDQASAGSVLLIT